MMSVQSEPGYLRQAMLAGARDFLTKPISSEELYTTIRRVYNATRLFVSRKTNGYGVPQQSFRRRREHGNTRSGERTGAGISSRFTARRQAPGDHS